MKILGTRHDAQEILARQGPALAAGADQLQIDALAISTPGAQAENPRRQSALETQRTAEPVGKDIGTQPVPGDDRFRLGGFENPVLLERLEADRFPFPPGPVPPKTKASTICSPSWLMQAFFPNSSR